MVNAQRRLVFEQQYGSFENDYAGTARNSMFCDGAHVLHLSLKAMAPLNPSNQLEKQYEIPLGALVEVPLTIKKYDYS